jgi:hypothetical protein
LSRTYHVVYMDPGAAAAAYVDDYVTVYAAWSAEKKLIRAYAGSLIRVRRDSDNTEQDIGPDGDGNLDTAALTTFVGANNGYIRTVYDQMGVSTSDMVQATQANQPRIVNAGVVETNFAVFDGSNDYLRAGAACVPGPSTASLFMKFNGGTTGTGAVYVIFDVGYTSNTESGWALLYDPRVNGSNTPGLCTGISDYNGAFHINSYPSAGTGWAASQALLSCTFVKGGSSSSSCYINGSLATPNAFFTGNPVTTFPAGSPSIGFAGWAGTFYSGISFQSAVVTSSSADIAQRANIEAVLT